MSWAFGNWQDFLKKKACRYILQHYLGQFLKEKLSLDQLSLDLYNGTGTITDLNLDVQAVNDDLATYNVPVELVDGFVARICVNIPWSSLVQDSTKLEVKGLELTLQPKQREDNGMMAGEMFSSMQSSMTTSLQLARDCLQSEKGAEACKAEPIEGVQKFACMIDSVLSKVRVSMQDTVVRLEHHPGHSAKGVAMEVRIKSIEFFDDLATAPEGSSVDGAGTWEPAAISQKNFHVDGVQIFFDEITTRPDTRSSRSRSSSEESTSQMFTSVRSTVSSLGESTDTMASSRRSRGSPPLAGGAPSLESNPIQVATITGRQEIKLKTKQSDTLHGPKLEILCQFGALHVLLSPRQLHGIIELVSGLNSPASCASPTNPKSSLRNKPMEATDYQRVESELQHQLQSGRIQSNNLAQMTDYSLHGDEDDQFFSLMSQRPAGGSDMDSSFSSNISGFSNRTTSTVPSSTALPKGPSKAQKDPFSTPKFHEDPSAELTHYHVRVAFFSVTLLHNNPAPAPAPGSDTPRNTSSTDIMKETATRYFQRVGGVTGAGVPELRQLRKEFAAMVTHDHLRLLGKPLTLECTQKTAVKQLSSSVQLTVGVVELVESLYHKRERDPNPDVCEILTFRKDGLEKKPTLYSSMHGGTPCFTAHLKTISSNKRSSRPGGLPHTDIQVSLGELQAELDLTLVDRINGIITPDTIITPNPAAAASMYHTAGAQYYSITQQTLDEGPSMSDQRFTLQLTSSLASLNIRFPVPDLRKESHVDKTWYQRNLREEVLILDLEGARVRTEFTSSTPLEQIQLACTDLHGYFKFMAGDTPIHFAHVRGEGGEEGFNTPTILLKFVQPSTQSLLDEEMYSDDSSTTPGDSLNGACQFARVEPSPFSSQRHMFDRAQGSEKADSGEKTEQRHMFDRAQGSEKADSGEKTEQLINIHEVSNYFSLNGACQFARAEPSPFSSQRHMFDRAQGSEKADSGEKTEQMVLPADREELGEFIQRSVGHTSMTVDISLPQACLFLPDKNFFEVLYNRLNNDLLLWEPQAPAPVTSTQEHFAMPHTAGLNVYDQLLHTGEHFEMAKSGIQFDSDTDTDEESINHYSIHDSRYPRRKRTARQQQSKMCLSLSIGRGHLTAFTQAKDVSGVLSPDRHGEVLLQLSDFTLFTVSGHGGDPDLQYLNILANKVNLYHEASIPNTEPLPLIDCDELSAPVPPHLQHGKVIYRSETGVQAGGHDGGGGVSTATDSPDMLSLAIKIKLDTLASKTDLTSDEKVKEFLVAVGIRGATMRYRMSKPYQNVFIQLMDLLDVTDYPILGYIEPKVLTELHVHLWTCAIDYRPLHLPMKAVMTANSFSISSNIVAESSISLLRFVLDDGALFISKRIKPQRTDLRKDYVCVTDIGRLEILLRSYDGQDQRHPKTDLRVSTNRINVRTCADSCLALIDLIRYLADDGDLQQHGELSQSLTDIDTPEPDISVNTDEGEKEENSDTTLVLPPLSESSMDHVHSLMTDAMLESSDDSASDLDDHLSPATDRKTEVFFVPQTGREDFLPGGSSGRQPIVITQTMDSVTSSTISGMGGSGYHSDEDEQDSDDFCIIDDAGWGKAPKDGEPVIRVFTDSTIEIRDFYFTKPAGRTDLLKAPDSMPMPEYRYTLKELTAVWYMYGGSDFVEDTSYERSTPEAGTAEVHRGEGMSVSFHRGSPGDRWSGHAGGRELPAQPRDTLHTRGGTWRNHSKCMEFQLTKVRLQHEKYPASTEAASRQVLLIQDLEIRDRLKTSKINKFLYQYSSEDMPRQTYANMVHIKALHRRPNPAIPEQECSMKVSMQPIRLNIDQDTLFFLKSFIQELSGADDSAGPPLDGATAGSPPGLAVAAPPPVMCVNKQPGDRELSPDPQDLLMQFDELTQDLQASLRGSLGSSSASSHSDRDSVSTGASTVTVVDNSSTAAQPVFFKSFVFSPEVPIKIDYHGKFDREHGTLAGFGGLVSLNRSEVKLKRLSYKQGLLGTDRLLSYCVNEWLTDIKVNQLPNILGGFGPMHSFVMLAHGVKDLFWLPVEQYRKDGRIVRGLQRGATSFSMSTAMSVLELTNRVVQSVQWCAELTFNIVSPGPRRRAYCPRQPADLREGVSNAYIVLREGFTETASNIVDAATKEHESKGVLGAMGGVIRQIPPTVVQPLIIVPEATSNLIGGLRSQLKPDVRKEDEEKWKEEIVD